MYKLVLRVESRSTAKVLGMHVKDCLVGQNFEVAYKLENIGDRLFPGGSFSVVIHWSNGQFEQTPYTIPELQPGEIKPAEPRSSWGVLSRGFALFYLVDAKDNDGKEIIFYRSPQDAIPKAVSFYSVLGKEPEELYQFWALIATVISLLILVGDKVLQLIIWMISKLN
jgi:hypothetical protein